MSSATQPTFVKDAWQSPRNARTLQAFMALRNEEIAGRIRALREGRGSPPQTTVAAALGVGERTYQTWENGEAKPGYANLQRLAEYYKVGEDFILTGVASDETTPSPVLPATQLDRIERLLEENQKIMLALAAGMRTETPAQGGPPWAALDRLREELAARDRQASQPAPPQRRTSTG